MQQFRFDEALSFNCFRCGQNKKSKLGTIYRGDWHHFLCNGCYGRLLSIYEIQADASDDDAKAEALAELLLAMVSQADIQAGIERMYVSEHRAQFLSGEALKFLITAEYVAGNLRTDPALDWCPAVIGLCKACEFELLVRLFQPLRALGAVCDLGADMKDVDLRQVAQFCRDPQRRPPELGAAQHFLEAASRQVSSAHASPLIDCLRKLLASWPRSGWLLSADGAASAIGRLRVDFRNKAAHTDELGQQDFSECFALVAGPTGLLWQLIAVTQTQKGLEH